MRICNLEISVTQELGERCGWHGERELNDGGTSS
jgi:hypothetical protein